MRFGRALALTQKPDYHSPVTSKKGVIGIGLPCVAAAKSRNLRRSCGFYVYGPLYGGPNVGPQGRLTTASAATQVDQPVRAAASIGLDTAVLQLSLLEAVMAQSLSIGSSAIRDQDGLFSLNDLHRASGGAQKHRPKYFLCLEQTRGLVREIQKGGITPFKTTQGRTGGTWVCRELVIAYAAWISAAFHLKVIRVFMGTAQSQPKPLTLMNRRFYVWIDEKGNEVVEPLTNDHYVLTAEGIANAIKFGDMSARDIHTIATAANIGMMKASLALKRDGRYAELTKQTKQLSTFELGELACFAYSELLDRAT